MKQRGIVIVGAASNEGAFHISAMKVAETAHITLSGYIGEWREISEAKVDEQIKGFKKDGVTKAVINLNTMGGSVFTATQIVNLIEESFEEVKVIVGALAASAGTYFTSSFYSIGKPNSQFMIHKPKGTFSGDVDKVTAELKSLENLTGEYLERYSTKTGLTTDKIKALWEKGDYWMNAKEALALGFIDEIEEKPAKITAEDVLMLVACAAPEIPKPTANINQTTDMDSKIIAVKLGLPENATEQQISAKLDELKAEAQTATQLQAQLDGEKEATRAADIKAMLDTAEKDKKITPSTRAQFEALAKQEGGFENVKAIIDNAQPVAKIETAQNPKGDAAAAEQKDWAYADYQEKDPEAFLKLQEEDPEAAEALIEAHYKE